MIRLLIMMTLASVACSSPEENTADVFSVLETIIGSSAAGTAEDGETARNDSVAVQPDTRYTEITEADFKKVADELGVEVAAIKAVVSIEAGNSLKGFYAPGVPVVNFDRVMYNRYVTKTPGRGVKGEKVPAGLKGYALQEWTQLINARKVHATAAYMGTFWGMFQIGGFNYKRCGCSTVDEFVSLVSESEFAQLELFAKFITNCGMLDDLRNKNWTGFARKYNGANYAKRGYHTKMANAYKRYKNEEAAGDK